MSQLRKFLPSWLIHYPREKLGADLIAGVIVSILVIPQSLAYALLAGLPPQFGLYVSIFPVIAYALIGSSMVQAVGPVAITAIMTYTVLSPIAVPGSPEWILLAATLSLLSGLLVLAFGLLHMGFLSQLLSRPVMSGFISGSAVLIVLSQVKYLLGIFTEGSGIWDILSTLLHQLPNSHGPTLAIGFSALVFLVFAKLALPTLLAKLGVKQNQASFIGRLMPLITILIGTLLVVYFNLDQPGGVRVVGEIPEGLPSFKFFLPGLDSLQILAVPALLMALVGMVQNISMAQTLAFKRQERVDANAELVGLGTSNIVASMYGGMPVGGGISRSAVNVAAGAETPLASIVAASCMLVMVATAAQWLGRLPLAVLAANIMLAAISMLDFKTLRQAWAYDRIDAIALLGTASGVIFLDLERGIALGIAFSFVNFLLRASTPHIAVIGRISNSEHFRNVDRHQVETIPGVLLLRIDESLFFGNLNSIDSRLGLELAKAPTTTELVLIMSAVNRIDTTAMEALVEHNRELAKRGIRLHFAEVKGPVQDRLMRSPLWESLSGQVFLSVNDAFETLAKQK
jgi:SulP family sulfate permease